MKGGRGIALVINVGHALASFASSTSSSVVTLLSVAQEGHSTSFACRMDVSLNFIGIALFESPNSPKYSVVLLMMVPPTLFSWCSSIISLFTGDWRRIALVSILVMESKMFARAFSSSLSQFSILKRLMNSG